MSEVRGSGSSGALNILWDPVWGTLPALESSSTLWEGSLPLPTSQARLHKYEDLQFQNASGGLNH